MEVAGHSVQHICLVSFIVEGAIGALESQKALVTGSSPISYSEQQIVDWYSLSFGKLTL